MIENWSNVTKTIFCILLWVPKWRFPMYCLLLLIQQQAWMLLYQNLISSKHAQAVLTKKCLKRKLCSIGKHNGDLWRSDKCYRLFCPLLPEENMDGNEARKYYLELMRTSCLECRQFSAFWRKNWELINNYRIAQKKLNNIKKVVKRRDEALKVTIIH